MMQAKKGRVDQDPLHVLLLEDEMLVASLIASMLQDLLGHIVIGPVARLAPGLELAKRAAIDLALLDVNVNGEAVYPIAATLDARGIPFILTTGYGYAELDPAYRDRPMLQKPFRAGELKAAIGDLLRLT